MPCYGAPTFPAIYQPPLLEIRKLPLRFNPLHHLTTGAKSQPRGGQASVAMRHYKPRKSKERYREAETVVLRSHTQPLVIRREIKSSDDRSD